MDALQELVGVGELRHARRVAQIGNFQALIAGQDRLLDAPELGPRRDGLILVLETVAHGDIIPFLDIS